MAEEFKLITDKQSPFFKDRQIGLGTAAPTSGTYKVGDFIISTSQSNSVFGWVCTVAGSPGTWKAININVENGTITMDKLANDVKQAIEDASNIDLTPYATKSDVGTVSSLSTTDKTVVGAINELFQNANNGKSTIATAIGSPVASTDTFAAMGTKINTIKSTLATNIKNKGVSASNSETMTSLANKVKNITAANDIKVDGTAVGSSFTLNYFGTYDKSVGNLPFSSQQSSSVVYNNEIHLLGSTSSTDSQKHYKWNGSSWSSVSTLPFKLQAGSVVVYNNEIHILGTVMDTSYYTGHYKWNGSTWTSVSTLPHNFYSGSAVVYNNEIHILGGSASNSQHYKWNGSTWTSVSTLPYGFSDASAVVYNNEIHILGNGNYNKQHYKWNGSTWTSVSTLPYEFYRGAAVIYNNKITIIGSGYMNASGGLPNLKCCYSYNGSSWSSLLTMSVNFCRQTAVVYKNVLYVMGGDYGSKYHYKISRVYEVVK